MNNNIDFYHMEVVYDAISDWFEKEGKKYLILFLKLLTSFRVNCVKVIWYEVEEHDNSIEVFRRFNVGKIPLTNAELIKASFLREKDSVSKSVKYSISKEWQQIENQLQSKFFWGFLKPQKEYPSRIEYIFDLLFDAARIETKDKNTFESSYGTDKHSVFRYFAEEIKQTDDLKTVWDKVNEVFEKLLQWYNHPEHYHYIGYLQNNEGKKRNVILELLSLKFKTKQELTDYLISTISNESKSFFKNNKISIDYTSNKKELRNLFFLFNIESYVSLSQSSKGEQIYRLPFELYNSVNFDIEHIDSKTEKEVSSLKSEEKLEFLKDLELDFGFEIGKPFEENTIPLFKESDIEDKWKEDNIKKEILNEILDSTIVIVNDYLEKDSDKLDDSSKNNIGNLTILNESINRSYGNSYFNTKRRLIIDEDKKGIYIPIATKNVFLKYFSGKIKKHTLWSKSDAESYQKQIEKSLAKFIK